MGLALQPSRRISGKIATLIAVFALVMQPMYGLAASRVANAVSLADIYVNSATPEEENTYSTIASAIEAASDEDIIEVTGTYDENITINKPVTLRASSAGATIESTAALYAVNITSSNATLEGFTINQTGNQVAVKIPDPKDDPALNNINILGNKISNTSGKHALYGGKASNSAIIGNTFHTVANGIDTTSVYLGDRTGDNIKFNDNIFTGSVNRLVFGSHGLGGEFINNNLTGVTKESSSHFKIVEFSRPGAEESGTLYPNYVAARVLDSDGGFKGLFATLDYAVSTAATSGDTVRLEKNTSIDSALRNIDSDITLDGNHKTITAGFVRGSNGGVDNTAITIAQSSIRIKNLTINATNTSNPVHGMVIDGTGGDRITGVSLENTTINGATIGVNINGNADVSINGIHTSGSMWGGVAVNYGSALKITGTNTHAEASVPALYTDRRDEASFDVSGLYEIYDQPGTKDYYRLADTAAPTDVVATSDIDGEIIQTPNHTVTFSAKDDAGLKRFDVTLWKKNDNRSDRNTRLGGWGSVMTATERTEASRTINILDSILYSSNKNLADGEYIIYFTATDLADKSTNGNSVTFTVDTIPPVAPKNLEVRANNIHNAHIPSGGLTNFPKGTLSWRSSTSPDFSHYVYKFWTNFDSNTETNPWTTEKTNNRHIITATTTGASVPLGYYAEGKYYFCVTAVDFAGNESACSATYTVIYDTTPPAAQIITPNDGNVVSGAVDITGKMTDETQVGNHWFEITGDNYSLNTGAGVDNGTDSWTYSWNTVGLADGTYAIRYVAKDKAGNRNDITDSVIHIVTVDNTPPAVSINPSSAPFNTNRPTITGTTDLDATSVEVSTDSGTTWTPTTHDRAAGTWSYAYTSNLTNTSHTILARAIDEYGNTGEGPRIATSTFTVAVAPANTNGNNSSLVAPEGNEAIITDSDTEEGTQSPIGQFNLNNLSFLPQGNAVIGNSSSNVDSEVASALDVRGEDGDVLAAEDGRDQWSIINLLLSIVVGALSVIALLGLANKTKDGRKTATRLLTLVPVVGAGAVLLLVEDFAAPMGWVNIWTLLIGALVVVQMVLLASTRADEPS